MTSQLSIFNAQRFHNSTQETDEKLLGVYEETSRRQDKTILAFIKKNQGPRMQEGKMITGWSSFELEKVFPLMPRESIRRACSNNSRDTFNPDGYLIDTGEKREGKRENGVKRKYNVWQYKAN